MTHPSNILFLAEGQLGDQLLMTPALHAVKETDHSAQVSVMVLDRNDPGNLLRPPSQLEPLELTCSANAAFATNPDVDHLYLLSRQELRRHRGGARAMAELAVARWLRRKQFSTVICTFPEDRFVQWAFASGAKIRIGQREQPLRWLLTQTVAVRKEEVGVLEYYCALVEAIGAHATSRATAYHIPDDARTTARGMIAEAGITPGSRIVAVHPGASGDYKIWPPERFAALLRRLSSEPGIEVLLCHGAADADIIAAIDGLLTSPPRKIDTGVHVGVFAAILEQSALCISNDSGPRHLAVAVGTPSLALFRLHHDKEWKVYQETSTCRTIQGTEVCPACPPDACRDKVSASGRFGSYCMRMIAPEKVVDEALGMLRAMPARK